MKQIDLTTAVVALFRQELTRNQIAKELDISVEDIDEIMGSFVFDNSDLPFYFKDKFNLLITPIMELPDLPLSITNKFVRDNLTYFWQTLTMGKRELLTIKGFGKKCLSDFTYYIQKILYDKGKSSLFFYEQYPFGLKFTKEQLKTLKDHSPKTLWVFSERFFN